MVRHGTVGQALLLIAGCTVGSPQQPSDGSTTADRGARVIDASPRDTTALEGRAPDLPRCIPPEARCGTECIDTSSRFDHCGGCNRRCADLYGSRSDDCSEGNCVCAAADTLCSTDEFCTATGCNTECPEQQQCGTQCCTASQTCLGTACCANDKVCDGACCASDQSCIADTCCPATRACGAICCASNQACVGDACCATADVCNDDCCTAAEDCLAGGCCASDKVCNAACCTSAQTCVDGACCPDGKLCNGACCAGDETCVDGACCPTGQVCGSPAVCCASGHTCVDGACCPDARACDAVCCAADAICLGTSCCAVSRACGNLCCTSGQLCLAGPFGPECAARPPDATAFYLTDAPLAADLGGQGGIDTECARQRPAALQTPNCFAPAAFLSYSASAQISTMPSYYGLDAAKTLYWFNRTTNVLTAFANNWADALDDSITVTVADGTGQSFGTGDSFWTGSNHDGTYASAAPDDFTCLGWTTTSAANTQGMTGDPNSLTGWIDHALKGCADEAYVICVCKISP